MNGYPKWFLPALLGMLGAVFVTGLLLAPTTLAMRAELEIAWRLQAGARVLVAALHATACFVLLMLVGALWPLHMRSGWRRRQQRVSGTLLGTLLMLLAASAVGVYYLGEDLPARIVALLHLALGLVAAVPFGWHWWHCQRVAERNAAAARQAAAASVQR